MPFLMLESNVMTGIQSQMTDAHTVLVKSKLDGTVLLGSLLLVLIVVMDTIWLPWNNVTMETE